MQHLLWNRPAAKEVTSVRERADGRGATIEDKGIAQLGEFGSVW